MMACANQGVEGIGSSVGRRAGKLLVCVGAALVLSLVLAVMPAVHAPGASLAAYADDPIGTITYQNGSKASFTDFKKLKLELEKHKNETMRVDMLCDWTASAGTVTERLKIPSGSVTTMYMHGYMIDREMTRNNNFDWDGEVIDVEPGATFELIGGEGDENGRSQPHMCTSRRIGARRLATTQPYL